MWLWVCPLISLARIRQNDSNLQIGRSTVLQYILHVRHSFPEERSSDPLCSRIDGFTRRPVSFMHCYPSWEAVLWWVFSALLKLSSVPSLSKITGESGYSSLQNISDYHSSTSFLLTSITLFRYSQSLNGNCCREWHRAFPRSVHPEAG
jgi:hypothetical protein